MGKGGRHRNACWSLIVSVNHCDNVSINEEFGAHLEETSL